jgi:hypothetical protein
MRPFFLSFEEMLMCLKWFAPLSGIAALVGLAGCGSPNDPGVGGVTKAEAEQLNEAADELNQDGPPPSVIQPVNPKPQKAPSGTQ